MKLLDGQELAGFIKERHARQARLLQSAGIKPKLAIVQAKDDPVINTYVRLKKQYGSDIQVEVEVHTPGPDSIQKSIEELNGDKTVHGIIVQLPLPDPNRTEQVVNMVAGDKDVDALGEESVFEPATPMAIMWLLAGYNIELRGKKILLIGRGKLVGAPLGKLLQDSDYNVEIIDREIDHLPERVLESDVIITATGSPALLYPDMLKPGAIVVDAGVASEEGKTVGDLAPEVYQREDLTVTPAKGGVGPLTVCALFENVLRAAEMSRSRS